ncbi:MAG: RagB/SusD family nutrient uptake outer membrane protein [Bacteroidales bacterium]|nr:RagB/SusD family nutrient uptake outer membrane protein [Bacteroidales bacterium]
MKTKLIYSLLALALVAMPGCKDFLDQDSPSASTPEELFESLPKSNYAIMGAYRDLISDRVYNDRMNMFWMPNTDIEMATGATLNGSDFRAFSNYISRPGFSGGNDLDESWPHVYGMFNKLNLAIHYIPLSPASSDPTTREGMAILRAEALVLRAHMYMEMIRAFGDIPFVINPAFEVVFDSKKDRDEIYEHLLNDLAEAVEILPWVGGNGAMGVQSVNRVNKGYALGLTARIAMYRAGYSIRPNGETRQGTNPNTYYQIAKNAVEKLINEGPHSLTPSFAQYFITQCAGINQSESLWEIDFGRPGQTGSGGTVAYCIGVRHTGTTNQYSNSANTAYILTSPIFFYSFHDDDTRRDVTVSIGEFNNESSASNSGPAGYRQRWTNLRDFARIGKWDLKYLSDAAKRALETGTGKRPTGANWPVMRYSDALLLHAEASYHLGEMADAMSSLMQVRNRAFPTNPAAAANINSDFFQAIVDERAWELAGENHRKWDLIRWNLLGEHLERFKDEHYALAERGELPARLGGGLVPSRLYFRFHLPPAPALYQEINMSTVNWRNEVDPADTVGHIENGIYNIRFFPIPETSVDLNAYLNWLDVLNAGYFKSHNNHLFALPERYALIAKIENDPYWAQVPPVPTLDPRPTTQ